ncbi:MAG TPA: FKBP-type peptidyl-prolyl cis-trans isomerase [Flavisolibacter sp.]|nr:FKBP-type peptidyl-prolyl cis-trans isomerase [Flavisolibacter sp.]
MFKKFLFGLSAMAIFSGCLKSSPMEDPCDYDPCEFKAPQSEIQAVQDYLTSNGINATQDCSGLFYYVDGQGTGANPGTCSIVTVQYEGRFTNGSVFEATTSPVSFGVNQVIRGWRNGLPKVKAGGSIYLYIPPSLAYGSSGNSSIPPNSILIFKVDLIAVQ